MSLVLGIPFRDVYALVFGRGEFKFMFWLIVLIIVLFILACLTNPTESSFRAYLTEQSFRRHLNNLDDNADDNNHIPDRRRPKSSSKNTTAPSTTGSSAFAADKGLSIHFANRATISLRTPKHVFHSFGPFTIAATLPPPKAPNDRESRDGSAGTGSDTWYVGAFGRWWMGGIFEEWYQDVIANSKDDDGWTPGITSMKRLDMLKDYSAPTFNANSLPTHLAPGSPPRLRNRERPPHRNDSSRPRSASPPPLPKSASLPMHTVRNGNRVYDSTRLRSQPQGQSSENSIRRVSSPPLRSSSSVFDQSPIIAEVLRQIANAKASIGDLHTQLTECQTSATQSKALLQQEVDAHRDRKRQEDASKAELKNRTKNLEDSKRGAEGLKKDADKKLKVAQTTRDNAAQRLEYLDSQILRLQQELAEDTKFIASHKNQVAEEEREITLTLERKRLEVKTAEDQVQALNQRCRDLEENLASGRERLRQLREKAEQAREKQQAASSAFERQQQVTHSQDVWVVDTSVQPLTSSPLQSNEPPWNPPSESLNGQRLPFGRQLSQDQKPPLLSSIAKTPFDEPLPAVNGNGFAPFVDVAKVNGHVKQNSGSAQVYYSPDLGSPFNEDGHLSRSFKSDSDPYVDKHWSVPYTNAKLDGSPLTPSSIATTDDLHASPFGTYIHSGPHSTSTQSHLSALDKPWLRGSSLSSKGLNPDAKEFNLFPTSGPSPNANPHGPIGPSPAGGYDVLNPSGFPTTTTTTQQSLLRAFALSPAEREALQRNLGSLGNNKSLDRLPSLSDVGSVPSSPTTNAHAMLPPPRLIPPPSHTGGSDLSSHLPAWLQSLPRNRKVNFSPWDDEEPQVKPSSQKSFR